VGWGHADELAGDGSVSGADRWVCGGAASLRGQTCCWGLVRASGVGGGGDSGVDDAYDRWRGGHEDDRKNRYGRLVGRGIMTTGRSHFLRCGFGFSSFGSS
jgi:hypothetical protein